MKVSRCNMFLAIISALVCFGVTTMMYTPKMRDFKFYRPVAFVFLFEGVWVLADYIFRQLIPDNTFMMLIHYIGLIALGVYFSLAVFLTSKKQKDKKKGKSKDND